MAVVFQFYSILDSSEGVIFMHVDNPRGNIQFYVFKKLDNY